jgi:hypothetical protein
MTEPVIICVLGMHRSGTSLVTGLLNLLGVYLGPPQHLMKPLPDNPKGFWEHRLIAELNDQVLSALGGNWCQLPAFPPDWEHAPELESLRRRAVQLIQRDFEGAQLWGWKDPRSCLTVPFWRELLPPMRYVVCLRNPVDVARSLARRNGFSLAEGIRLWLLYTKHCLEQTADQPRLFVSYEEVIKNRSRELRRLATFVGRPKGVDQVENAAQSLVAADLHHHHTSVADSTDEAKLGLPASLLQLAQQIYLAHGQEELTQQDGVNQRIREALYLADVERVKREPSPSYRWHQQVREAMEEIATLVPRGETFILPDSIKLGAGEVVAGRHCIPLCESDGHFAGRPASDAAAIGELERLRQAGAKFIVFAWPAFWWLECYAGLHRHLQSTASCLVKSDRVVVFDLRPRAASRQWLPTPNRTRHDNGGVRP